MNSNTPATTPDFGPQTSQVVAFIDRIGTLTPTEINALGEAWRAVQAEALLLDAAWFAVWRAEQGAARGALLEAAWDAVRGTKWYSTWFASWDSARAAVRGTVWTLIVRDLTGQYSFTQAHYDLLTAPWRRVIGPIHPDDEELGR